MHGKSSDEVEIFVPQSGDVDLVPLLRRIENEIKNGRLVNFSSSVAYWSSSIVSYGISMTSLEDAFLSIMDGEKHRPLFADSSEPSFQQSKGEDKILESDSDEGDSFIDSLPSRSLRKSILRYIFDQFS